MHFWRGLTLLLHLTPALSWKIAETTAQLELIKDIRVQSHFSSLLFLRHSQECAAAEEELIKNIEVPRILLNERQAIYMRGGYNKQLLAVVCMSNASSFGLLQNLSTNLNHMRFTRVLLLLQWTVEGSKRQHTDLESIFKFCERKNMLNVIAIYRDFNETENYFAYRKFPQFQLLKRKHFRNSTLRQLYPNRMKNMYGHGIRTLPDDIEPRSIVYVDALGQTQVTGCIWLILEALTWRLNASLVLPFAIKPRRIFYNDMLKFTRNDTIDIAASITTSVTKRDISEFSYPPYFLTWCVMLPEERELPSSDILLMLSCSTVTAMVLLLEVFFSLLTSGMLQLLQRVQPNVMDLLLHSSSLRGVLGQPFPFPPQPKLSLKLLYMSLCVAGLFYSNMYVTSLHAFLTRPPRTKHIANLDDLEQTPLRIHVLSSELDAWPAHIQQRYAKVFNATPDIDVVVRTRDTLDQSYAFVVSSDRWLVYDEQQRLFARRLFRFSDICPFKWLIINMMIQENSIYREVLDDFIHELNAAGLIQYWLKSSFRFMLQAGRVTFEDLSTPSVFAAAELQDFYWIWVCYLVLMAICCICFVVELMRPPKRSSEPFKV